MKRLQDASTRVLPRRLMHQVLALAALVIIISGTIYSVIAARRIDEMGRLLLENQAAGLAYSVASGGALHLVNGDPAGLERLLYGGQCRGTHCSRRKTGSTRQTSRRF